MKGSQLEVLFSPAEFEALKPGDLEGTTCVVFDVLRATSTIVTALANGAECVIPALAIDEALDLARRHHPALLAGERHGLRITAEVSGGREFDLGNSPREFTSDRVRGQKLITTTTNGTRALRACTGAREILVCSLLNLKSTAERIRSHRSHRTLLVCGGTYEEAAYEDIIGAGGICSLLWDDYPAQARSDSALAAYTVYMAERGDLPAALGKSRNGQRLLTIPELREDPAWCARLNTCNFACVLEEDGCIRRR